MPLVLALGPDFLETLGGCHFARLRVMAKWRTRLVSRCAVRVLMFATGYAKWRTGASLTCTTSYHLALRRSQQPVGIDYIRCSVSQKMHLHGLGAVVVDHTIGAVFHAWQIRRQAQRQDQIAAGTRMAESNHARRAGRRASVGVPA